MGNVAELQDVLYNTEASFCEVATTFSTALPLIEAIDLSGLARDMAPQPIVRSMPWQGTEHVLMPWEGKSITLKFRLTGLGATTAGAVPASELALFISQQFGSYVDGFATGTTFTGGTAAVPTFTAGSIVDGALFRGGAIGDGRLGGEFFAVGDNTGLNLTLLMAAAAAPNNGDVLWATKNIHPVSVTAGAFDVPTTFRLRILTSNGKYDLRGCFPVAAPTFSGTSPGEVPEVTVTLGVSAVVTNAGTFPSATVPQRHASSPVTNGVFAIQEVGVTTRATEAIREISWDLGFTGEGIKGPGGAHEGQCYQAARRKAGMATMEFVTDNSGPNTWRDRAITTAISRKRYQALWTMSCADGRAVGIYWPNLRFMGAEPIQVNHGGYNRERVRFEACLNSTTSSDIVASPWRIAFA